jgi:hypothetical protein
MATVLTYLLHKYESTRITRAVPITLPVCKADFAFGQATSLCVQVIKSWIDLL